MLGKLFILTLVVFAFGSVNISAQAVNDPEAISKGVLNGSAVILPKPPYPPAAQAVRASGAVNIQVLIDENGNVISASAVSGHPLLRQSAVDAARGAKFNPAVLSGKVVRVKGIIIYNFVLPKDANSEAAVKVPIIGSAVKGVELSGAVAGKQGKVLNGLASSLPKPVYPPAAKAVKASGAVSVEVVIDEDGNVEKAEAIAGHPLLRAAAVEAARGAKFKPTLLEGQPVKVAGVIIYNFVP